MNRKRNRLSAIAVVLVLAVAACSGEPTSSTDIAPPNFAKSASAAAKALTKAMAEVNAGLEADGAPYRVGVVEWLAGPGADEAGQTVFFANVGNKQLGHDFVPGDPRRPWSGAGSGDDITWTSDMTEGDAGPGLAATQAAINAAMATWQGVSCSNIPLTYVAAAGDLGFLQDLLGFGGGSPSVVADITQGGFDTSVDILLPPPIIAATVTFWFVVGNVPTDIDNNGKRDTAFREVYYTGNFPWGIDTSSPIDVETVALHENGHGLSQAHFGTLFRTDSNGKFHFAPRAVMNAGYTGVQQTLTDTDNGGHCSNWAEWPNN